MARRELLTETERNAERSREFQDLSFEQIGRQFK
jgi:hypothetical protein